MFVAINPALLATSCSLCPLAVQQPFVHFDERWENIFIPVSCRLAKPIGSLPLLPPTYPSLHILNVRRSLAEIVDNVCSRATMKGLVM